MIKVWEIKPGGRGNFNSIDEIRSVLLRQRGVTDRQFDDYLAPQIETGVHEPGLMADMAKAVDRIWQAIKNREHILVYGDYDVDGVCSTAIIMLALFELGAKAAPFLPHRTENGYGLDKKVLSELIGQFDLLVTVDCGISNNREIRWLREQGKDTIVTDHHLVPDKLPPALAVLHPDHPRGQYPTKFLCGAGVSWKLAMALLMDVRAGGRANQEIMVDLLGLACLGTIADMVPLLDENRVIVKHGLRALANANRPGLKTLVAGIKDGCGELDAESIAFQVAPLINAAGRMDHPQTALDLLLADSAASAEKKLWQLQQLNRERRRVGKMVQDQAEAGEIAGGGIIFAADANWPAGVLGLVAGRLCDKYRRPAVVVGRAGRMAVGSARAPGGVNMMEILKPVGGLLQKFGGHEAAAGFSLAVADIGRLEAGLVAQTGAWQSSGEVVQRQADIMLSQGLVGWNLMDLLEQMAPYGQGNERPVFMLPHIYLEHWTSVGRGKEHAKLALNVNDERLDGIGFGLVTDLDQQGIRPGQMVDMLGYLEINDYRGRRSLQINVKDMGRTGEVKIMEQ